MKHYSFKVDGKEYKLRLTAQAIVELEKELGCSLISFFADLEKGAFPSMSTLLTIFEKSLRVTEPSVTTNEVYEIYDKFVEEGNAMTNFFQVIINIIAESGIINNVGEQKVPPQKKK